MGCPMVRPELEALPARLRSLPVDARGYPVPWFVAWVDGKPEFRAMDGQKWRRAVRERRCWVCGQSLGAWLAFVIGPMCGINRTTAEPPCHLECAEWSARNCPFLSRPHMTRREDETTDRMKQQELRAGLPLDRNPGVTLVWVTRSYQIFNDGKNKPLIEIGPPHRTIWYAQGRLATRAEVAASIDSGLPSLRELAVIQKGAEAELDKRYAQFQSWYPAA